MDVKTTRSLYHDEGRIVLSTGNQSPLGRSPRKLLARIGRGQGEGWDPALEFQCWSIWPHAQWLLQAARLRAIGPEQQSNFESAVKGTRWPLWR
jgi:hypothetical protein